MAKRKRLTPPAPQDLDTGGAMLETKSVFPNYPLGVSPKLRSAQPPISHVAGDAATAAALAEVSAELHAARTQGRMVQPLALDMIDAAHLVRDRVVVDPDEMAALRASIDARGQQTPIEVVETAQGYGLISGWRRLTALRSLFEETGEARFANVQALVRKPVDAADAYVAMVEENEIRVGLSYFERARIVLRAIEEGVYPSEKKALNGLFGAGSRTKRSKIKSFLPVVSELGGLLAHPAAIGERTGLALSRRLQDDAGFAGDLKAQLRARSNGKAESEQAVLQAALKQGAASKPKALASEPPLEVAPGVFMQRKGQGITLSGPGWNERIEARILNELRR